MELALHVESGSTARPASAAGEDIERGPRIIHVLGLVEQTV